MSQNFPGAGYPSVAWGGQPGPSRQQPRPKPDRTPVIIAAIGVVAVIIAGLVGYSLFSGPDYQNDDYVPPSAGPTIALPNAPASEAQSLLQANVLYEQRVPAPIRCDLSNPSMDVRTASDSEVETYIDELMVCNMRVWDEPFQATNRWELVRPVVNIYHESVVTPCGGGQAKGPNASYCGANQQVYFSRALIDHLPFIGDPHVVDMIMAHEFGHAVQARSLILGASGFTSQGEDESTQLEMSRRVEVQADCFSGLFLRSVGQSVGYTDEDWASMRNAVQSIAGDVQKGRPNDPAIVDNHGHGASRLYWHDVGLTSNEVGACNTFTAPSEYVR